MKVTKKIDESVSKGQQDAIARRVLVLDGQFEVRLTVRSDSYDFQSYARAEVWNPVDLKWNIVHTIHFSDMLTPAGLVYRQGLSLANFHTDMERLLEATKEILG